MAQLVARIHGMDEAGSSNLPESTKEDLCKQSPIEKDSKYHHKQTDFSKSAFVFILWSMVDYIYE